LNLKQNALILRV